MHPTLKSLKRVYDLLNEKEKAELITELERHLQDLMFRTEEKKALLSYLKGIKED